MRGKRPQTLSFMASLVAASGFLGCNSLIGLDQLKVGDSVDGSSSGGTSNQGDGGEEAAAPDCMTNTECTERFTREADAGAADADAGSPVPGACVSGHCVKLLSEDCTLITGDYPDDDAILIGSLYQTTGTTAAQNIQRRQGATLAIEEINVAGGIPTTTAGKSRRLVMVSCDAAANLVRAATHLTDDLHVPAIVGPNTSQDTLDVSRQVTVQAGVAVISPTAVAASIADVPDDHLTWLMIPSDGQRAPLMIQRINELETQLRSERGKSTIKFSIIYRDDAMGQGTRTSLNALTINGNALSTESTNGNVRVDRYQGNTPDVTELLANQVDFADIIVLAGTAEAITKVMVPLEAAWTAPNRPYYLGIDPFKGPDLLNAVKADADKGGDLRCRWEGTGTKPGVASAPVNEAFLNAYRDRYQTAPTASGCGTSYDASYAIAYALAATRDLPLTGQSIVQGLRMLSGGETTVTTGSRDLLTAFSTLANGDKINGIGTNCPLAWDENGSVSGGTIEIWRIGLTAATPSAPQYVSSGLTFDIETQTPSGTYTKPQCNP